MNIHKHIYIDANIDILIYMYTYIYTYTYQRLSTFLKNEGSITPGTKQVHEPVQLTSDLFV